MIDKSKLNTRLTLRASKSAQPDTCDHTSGQTALGGRLAGVPERGGVVVAESFSQAGASLAVRR
jgi:hypothetical protein